MEQSFTFAKQGKVTLKLQFKKLTETAKITAPRNGDAGYDLWADIPLTVIQPGETIKVDTGLSVAIPENWVGKLKDRSSVASKGLHILGGVIDSSYRGEIKVLLINVTNKPVEFGGGFIKFTQMVIVPHLSLELEEVTELEDTVRGTGGFGSTGA